MSTSLSIGALARKAGCTVPTIRYYEEIGLLPAAPGTEGGQRHYGEAEVRRLGFIRRCREFSFSIEQVRELMALVDEPDRPCAEIRDIAAVHLGQIRRKLAELRQLEASLERFVDSCDASCADGAAMDCTILEDLALPGRGVPIATPARCCAS